MNDERELDAVENYLIAGKPEPGGGLQTVSSFWAALRDARRATGRDQDTGVVVDQSAVGSWLGAIGYLCFIDQVGGAVRRPSRDPQPDDRAFMCALHNFCQIDDAVGHALYALRCCLAHDYSLTNKNTKHPELQHVFTLYPSAVPLVALPEVSWDGNYVGIPPDATSKTRVNVCELGELAEAIANDVLRAHADGDIDVRNGVSGVELVVRFGFMAYL